MSRWVCVHPTVEVRGKRTSVGIQYRRQCLTCGRSVGNAISHSEVSVFVEWDTDLERLWEEQARAAYRAEVAQREADLNQSIADRDEQRAEYMASSEWWVKRTAVMERERGLCRSCHDVAHDMDEA